MRALGWLDVPADRRCPVYSPVEVAGGARMQSPLLLHSPRPSFSRVIDLTHALGPDVPTYIVGAVVRDDSLIRSRQEERERWHTGAHPHAH